MDIATAPKTGDDVGLVTTSRSHADVEWLVEYQGGDRVFVKLHNSDLPALWPALTVPQSQLIPMHVYNKESLHNTHMCVMLLGLTDRARYTEKNCFTYVRNSDVWQYDGYNQQYTKLYDVLQLFVQNLLHFARASDDVFLCADGIDAARRFVAPLRPTKFSKLPDVTTQAVLSDLANNLNGQLWKMLSSFAGAEVLRELRGLPGGAKAFLASRKILVPGDAGDFLGQRDDNDPALLMGAVVRLMVERARTAVNACLPAAAIAQVQRQMNDAAQLASNPPQLLGQDVPALVLALLSPVMFPASALPPAYLSPALTTAATTAAAAEMLSNASKLVSDAMSRLLPAQTQVPPQTANPPGPPGPFFEHIGVGYDLLAVSMVPPQRTPAVVTPMGNQSGATPARSARIATLKARSAELVHAAESPGVQPATRGVKSVAKKQRIYSLNAPDDKGTPEKGSTKKRRVAEPVAAIAEPPAEPEKRGREGRLPEVVERPVVDSKEAQKRLRNALERVQTAQIGLANATMDKSKSAYYKDKLQVETHSLEMVEADIARLEKQVPEQPGVRKHVPLWNFRLHSPAVLPTAYLREARQRRDNALERVRRSEVKLAEAKGAPNDGGGASANQDLVEHYTKKVQLDNEALKAARAEFARFEREEANDDDVSAFPLAARRPVGTQNGQRVEGTPRETPYVSPPTPWSGKPAPTVEGRRMRNISEINSDPKSAANRGGPTIHGMDFQETEVPRLMSAINDDPKSAATGGGPATALLRRVLSGKDEEAPESRGAPRESRGPATRGKETETQIYVTKRPTTRSEIRNPNGVSKTRSGMRRKIVAVSEKAPAQNVVDDDESDDDKSASKPETAKTAEPAEPEEYVTRIPFEKAKKFLKNVKKRTPGDAFIMAPAPVSVLMQFLTPSDADDRVKDKVSKDMHYKCSCFPPDRENLTDFSIVKFGKDNAPVESHYAQIAQGVTPERLLRLSGKVCGIKNVGSKKALSSSLTQFSTDDASDVESTRFVGTFVEQGGVVLRHVWRDGIAANVGVESGRGREKRHVTLLGTGPSQPSSFSPKPCRKGIVNDKTATSKPSLPPADTWTTWSGRKTTKIYNTSNSYSSQDKKEKKTIGPDRDITNWLTQIRGVHKGESVSATCAYVTQRLVPMLKQSSPIKPSRLPKDESGNPVAEFSEAKDRETRNAEYYDSDDETVGLEALLPAVTVETTLYSNPKTLLNNAIEVSYLGVKAVAGSGGALFAAFGAAERLNFKRTPKFDAGTSEQLVSTEQEQTFYSTTLPIDDVFDMVRQGGEMMRDMSLSEREKFSLLHNRSGMPIRFRYLQFDVNKCSVKTKPVRKDPRSAHHVNDLSNLHPWDPRGIVDRPGNVVKVLGKVMAETLCEDDDSRVTQENSEKTKDVQKTSLRFYAAGSVVPLKVNRPFAFSEVTYCVADKSTRNDTRVAGKGKRDKTRKSVRAYQTVTHSKKVSENAGFIWYTVNRRDVPKLLQYIEEMGGRPEGESLNSSSILPSTLDSGVTWLDPAGIAKWNSTRSNREKITVHRHVQRCGAHFARAPGAARWGFCSGGCWLLESPFAFAEDWVQVAKEADSLEGEGKGECEESERDANEFGRVPRFSNLDDAMKKKLAPAELLASLVSLSEQKEVEKEKEKEVEVEVEVEKAKDVEMVEMPPRNDPSEDEEEEKSQPAFVKEEVYLEGIDLNDTGDGEYAPKTCPRIMQEPEDNIMNWGHDD